MSQVTKWIRAHGGGPVLDAVEGAAPATIQAAHDEAAKAGTVLLSEAGDALSSLFKAQVASKLGSGATFAETTLDDFLKEAEAFIASKF